MPWSEWPTSWWMGISGLLGLCIGSFLNVVIARLPRMMDQQWEADIQAAQGIEPPATPAFNLWTPRSHCTSCNTPLAWWHNIPLVSFALLRARCGHCKAPISWRYPAVELTTALLFLGLAWQLTPGLYAVALMGFVAALVALAMIDLDTFLLPDSITIPLVWAGLAVHVWTDTLPLRDAVLGAMLGYGLLWAVYHAFKIATGKEGMGYGDFKLLAAIGAWFGPQSLLTVLLTASVSGVVFGLIIQKLRGQSHNEAFPFGPCLVLGALAWIAGVDYLKWIA